ncbi:PP2C family protein-serine/threonine phosphatase [Actinomadura scrupuli]|uniref:PP2C family protein-serine/threonine phosphatase n=1 Tax=Actinomadura scrupuli TaxID=559629 RepID=UPI003D95798D
MLPDLEDDGPGGGAHRPTAAGDARLALLHEAGTLMAATLDMRQVARHLVEVALRRFADAVGVYLVEHLILGEEVPPPADGRSIEARRIAVGASGVDLEAWLATGEVVVIAADSPYAVCVNTGAPQRFSALGQRDLERIGHAGGSEALRRLRDLTDFVVVPLMVGTTGLGFVTFARGRRSEPFSGGEVRLAGEIAAHAARCLDNARLYGRERAAARALQASLLPGALDAVPGLEIAHRYLPAGSTSLVGGDWYDVIPLTEERAVLIIGDAMGHGSEAAAAMVQLRASARTLATLGLGPAEVLTWLDRIAPNLGPVQFATCLCALYDPSERMCTFSRAGHPPPILIHAGGGCELLEGPPGLPLGLGDARFQSTRVTIPDGATLALYTDGLVESRDRDLDAGIGALLSALTGAPDSLDATCGSVVEEMLAGPNEDDATVMLARAHAAPGGVA